MLLLFLIHLHVVQGRARHPQSQGGVEHSNKTFKEGIWTWIRMKMVRKERGCMDELAFWVYHVNKAINLWTDRLHHSHALHSWIITEMMVLDILSYEEQSERTSKRKQKKITLEQDSSKMHKPTRKKDISRSNISKTTQTTQEAED